MKSRSTNVRNTPQYFLNMQEAYNITIFHGPSQENQSLYSLTTSTHARAHACTTIRSSVTIQSLQRLEIKSLYLKLEETKDGWLHFLWLSSLFAGRREALIQLLTSGTGLNLSRGGLYFFFRSLFANITTDPFARCKPSLF